MAVVPAAVLAIVLGRGARAMNLGRYGTWWQQPWVSRIFLASLLARLPLQMYPLGVLLLVRERTSSFAVAGAVTAAAAAGYASTAPLLGRLVDRHGQTVPLTVTSLVSSGAFAGLLLVARTDAGGLLLAFPATVAGMSLPPVAAAQRSLWSQVLPDPEVRRTALTVDGIVLDLGLIVGPLIVTGIAVGADPAAAVATTAAMLLSGTLWFSSLGPSRQQQGARHHHDLLGPLGSAGIRVLVVGAALTGVVLGTLRVGFVAVAEQHGSSDLGGMLLSVFGIGSLVGGLMYGARSWPGRPAHRWVILLGCYTTGLIALVMASWSLPALSLVAVVTGGCLTPQVVTEFELVPICAPPATVSEAYAWSITATFAGSALGSAAGGAVAGQGARLPLVVGAVGAALATGIAWRWRHSLEPF